MNDHHYFSSHFIKLHFSIPFCSSLQQITHMRHYFDKNSALYLYNNVRIPGRSMATPLYPRDFISCRARTGLVAQSLEENDCPCKNRTSSLGSVADSSLYFTSSFWEKNILILIYCNYIRACAMLSPCK